jgi:hypothetical protein
VLELDGASDELRDLKEACQEELNSLLQARLRHGKHTYAYLERDEGDPGEATELPGEPVAATVVPSGDVEETQEVVPPTPGRREAERDEEMARKARLADESFDSAKLQAEQIVASRQSATPVRELSAVEVGISEITSTLLLLDALTMYEAQPERSAAADRLGAMCRFIGFCSAQFPALSSVLKRAGWCVEREKFLVDPDWCEVRRSITSHLRTLEESRVALRRRLDALEMREEEED